ncbi:hypothetical protein LTS00_004004 [Friedmanniomyces endolithicus]|nr:hypothetical protein LTS00_004004 [Friedmanniomyces endolithicus]
MGEVTLVQGRVRWWGFGWDAKMASNSTILSKQVADLRVELKAWEKEFALINGRKAGRDDISSDACMSVKYREFHRLRRPIDHPPGAVKVVTPRKTARHLRQPGNQQKRGALRERAGNGNGNANEVAVTPRKAWKGAGISLEVVLEEEQEIEPTPAMIRRALGPTPQKDGEVLGIFDFLATATPSKTGGSGESGGGGGVDGSHCHEAAATSINDTPNKPVIRSTPSKRARSATPQSSSKRRFLDAFVGTPLKRQRLDDVPTPSSSRYHFATPSFLRRSFPLAPVDEDVTGSALIPKKRGLVRSLSSLIQGLRKQEDKRMDDEWDIMNEIEAADENGADEDEDDSDRPPRNQQRQQSNVHVQLEDSHSLVLSEPEMPLGPDQGAPGSDSEDDEEGRVVLGADGRPRKPWKKKGLKRQTKRTNMRPVMHKAKKACDLEGVEEGGVEEDAEAVGETQDVEGCADAADDDDAQDAGDDDGGSGAKMNGKKGNTGETDGATAAAVSPTTTKQGKAPKKVSAAAHANFRRLKIKQKNTKPSGRGGRKFGKR